MVGSERVTAATIALVASPPILAFALVAGFVAAETLEFRPLNAEPANVSEASAMGAAAAALRFIANGSDPNIPWPIAEGVLGTLPRSANAIDAAILGRRAEMISLLRKQGAATDANRAKCLADAVDFPQALSLLGIAEPADPNVDPRQVGDPVGVCLRNSE
jgi:hypothetical protein